jgi:thiamine-monophosphate kinase
MSQTNKSRLNVNEMINKEIGFLSKIIEKLLPNSNLLKGNEDAVAIESGKINKNFLVLNIDTISWSSDALQTIPFTYKLFGRKIVAVTLSDLCAKGSNGKYFLCSISVPNDFTETNLEEITTGIIETCKEYSLEYLGGDLGTSKEIVLTGICIGESNQLIYRKNCIDGDSVWVTGSFGLTGLAFGEAYNGLKIPKKLQESLTQKVLMPTPKIRESNLLKKYVNACIDSSDGLAMSLYHLSNESGKQIVLNHLPIDSNLKSIEDQPLDYDLKNITLYGGEEFELVFTISPEKESLMLEEFSSNNLNLPIKIGKVSKGKPVVIDNTGSLMIELKIAGWDSLSEIK